jgi:hypothetical protein
MTGVLCAAVFIWLGMVLGISFLEAPLKFRAPGVDLAVGLGIGRLVFRALNVAELALLVVGLLAAGFGPRPAAMLVAVVPAGVVLLVQVLLVRPRLERRTGRVLAGERPPRSRAHHVYVGLEVLKVLLLVMAGVLVLGGAVTPGS